MLILAWIWRVSETAPKFEERIDSEDVMKQDVEELLGIYTDRERLTTSLHTEALTYCNI